MNARWRIEPHPQSWPSWQKAIGPRPHAPVEVVPVAEALEWRDKAEAEVERLRASLLTVVEQVESCCSRSGLCIDADRIRAEAQRPMDKPRAGS